MSTAAAIYVRISRDAIGSGLGVKRQRADCEKLAKDLGWTVAETFEDNDVSASKGKPRPGYDRMMTAVEQGRIAAVVVWDVDRLTRTPRELEDVIDHANRIGLQLASVGGEIDLGTEQGRMLARMKGTVARYEIEQSRRRLKAKHAELAATGRHNGPRPFGWDITGAGDKQCLLINDAEAAVVRECVDRVLAGEGIWKIARDLNERGVTTSTGKPWATQVLRRMLLRWRNCGIRTHKGKEVGVGQWEPIVDREIHERVVALLTDPGRRSNNRGTAPKYLLTSIAYCGECGEHVVGTNEFTYKLKNGRTRIFRHSYKCAKQGCMKVQRNMADVDELVEGVVVGVLERDGVRLLGGNATTAAAARVRIESLEAKLAIAADQYADDEITAEQLKRVSQRLRPQLDAERARLVRAQPDPTVAHHAGAGARQAWGEADIETKKRIIRLLGMRVTINRIGSGNGREFDPEKVQIEWRA